MAGFVRDDVGDVVDLLGVGEIGDEADAIRVRHRPRERLRELRVVGEFDHAGLVNWYGPKWGS